MTIRRSYSKYRAVRTEVNGITFASKREAKRFCELKMLEKAGEVINLELQPRFDLEVLSPIGEVVKIGRYTADFRYQHFLREVVEDVKSPASRTEAYMLRKRHVEAQYGIRIQEI